MCKTCCSCCRRIPGDTGAFFEWTVAASSLAMCSAPGTGPGSKSSYYATGHSTSWHFTMLVFCLLGRGGLTTLMLTVPVERINCVFVVRCGALATLHLRLIHQALMGNWRAFSKSSSQSVLPVSNLVVIKKNITYSLKVWQTWLFLQL